MKSNNKSTIAKNIKKYRQKIGILQDRLSKIAKALSVGLEDLTK